MKKRIMVLDDDEQIRQSLLKLLQKEDYEVVLAAEGIEALDKLESHSVDLLLLDLNLPNKSGWDVFERITSTSPLLPIIIITGREKQSDLAVAAGVGALMQKPLDVPLLLKTISELLQETPEKRLKRLAGIEQSTRCFQPASAALSVANSRKRERQPPGIAPHL
jgi:chemosensory pili system protein ChpA (sensor histidine kinase/response regulator)